MLLCTRKGASDRNYGRNYLQFFESVFVHVFMSTVLLCLKYNAARNTLRKGTIP